MDPSQKKSGLKYAPVSEKFFYFFFDGCELEIVNENKDFSS